MVNELQLKFGSLSLDLTNKITIRPFSIKETKDIKVYDIPKTDGSITETAKRRSLTISVEGDISGTEYDDLRTNLDTLRAALQNGIQKFTTDDDRFIYAQLRDFSFSYTVMRTLAHWSASFIAHYPFWQSAALQSDERVPTSGVGYTIANAGNAPARIKITVTAPAGGITDNCQIENTTAPAQLLKYRGTIANTKNLIIDNRVASDDFVVTNDGVDDTINFEGDFLILNAGNNTIEYTGTANAMVKLEWYNTWY